MFSNITVNKSKTEYIKQRFESILQIAWDILNNNLFIKLKANIGNRIKAYIATDN